MEPQHPRIGVFGPRKWVVYFKLALEARPASPCEVTYPDPKIDIGVRTPDELTNEINSSECSRIDLNGTITTGPARTGFSNGLSGQGES